MSTAQKKKDGGRIRAGGVVRGGTSCFPTSMTMAGLEPAIFASTNAIPLRLVQQGAGQSFGPTGQPDMSVLEP